MASFYEKLKLVKLKTGVKNIAIEPKLSLRVPAITEKNILEISGFITKEALINNSQGFIVISKIWFKAWKDTLVIYFFR